MQKVITGIKMIFGHPDFGYWLDVTTGVAAALMLMFTVAYGDVTEAIAWLLVATLSVRLIRG